VIRHNGNMMKNARPVAGVVAASQTAGRAALTHLQVPVDSVLRRSRTARVQGGVGEGGRTVAYPQYPKRRAGCLTRPFAISTADEVANRHTQKPVDPGETGQPHTSTSAVPAAAWKPTCLFAE